MIRFQVNNKSPRVDPSAVIAPTATLVGDVKVGPEAHISFGAVIIGESAPVSIGAGCVIRENVVIRSAPRHPVQIGKDVLIGAQAAVYGCKVGDGAFLATGVAIFHGSTIGEGAEVRIHGVVHVNTSVPARAVVPIGWVAVGDPAEIRSPDDHDGIWEVQQTLDFPGTVYGIRRRTDGTLDMSAVTRQAVRRDGPKWIRLD